MINEKSFILYNDIVKSNNYMYLFDIEIMFHVSEYENTIGLDLNEKKFEELCNEVKHAYLKYDRELNDDLIDECYFNLKKRGKRK